MTSPEDRLAALLREESETVVPAGDGLARIQARVARRRRLRWTLVPGAALVTAAAVTAFFAFGGNGGSTSLVQQPASPGPATTTPTPGPTGGGLDHAFENPALWPFTSAQEIGAWQSSYPYAGDKHALVAHYLTDQLHLPGLTTSTPCESCDVVDIRNGGTKVGQASLERYLVDGHPVYTIVTIGETDLKLLTPTYGEAVTSPTKVTGLIVGVDENVSLALLTQAGTVLATAGAPAGSGAPWSAQLSWTDADWAHGGIIAKTFSAKDGSLNRLTALPVMRGEAPATAFTPALWPFASHAQAEAWRQDPSKLPWAGSNLEVARHFVADYLRLSGVRVVQSCASCDVVSVVSDSGADVGTVTLVREDDGSPRAYSVAGVHAGNGLTVTSPQEGARLTSPLTVRGTVSGVDESIAVDLVTQSGRTIAHGTAAAGSDAPWSTELRWTDHDWYTGALVLRTYSPKDGSLNRLEVLRVVRGT